jgi:hypothetical protein
MIATSATSQIEKERKKKKTPMLHNGRIGYGPSIIMQPITKYNNLML